MSACEFDALREHKPEECPRCNPAGWMAEPTIPTPSPGAPAPAGHDRKAEA